MSCAAAWRTSTEGQLSCDYLVTETSRRLANPYARLSAERALAPDPAATLEVPELTDERNERSTTVIVTDNLQQAAAAANATAFMPEGRLVGHGPPTGMLACPDDYIKRDFTGRFG